MGCTSSSRVANDSEEKIIQEPVSEKKLRGDVGQTYEAKIIRERKIREKLFRISSAAEEMSGRILEEKERLSINSKSRATSRATSRAGSPSASGRKHVQFRPEIKQMNNLKETFGTGSDTLKSEKSNGLPVSSSFASCASMVPKVDSGNGQRETTHVIQVQMATGDIDNDGTDAVKNGPKLPKSSSKSG